jgi:hypothetical protein
MALFASLTYLFFTQNLKGDELIGIWSTTDDKNTANWNIEFGFNANGKPGDWKGNETENQKFEWARLGAKTIKIKASNNDDWTVVKYKLLKSKSGHPELTELGKDGFWESPRPLYKINK